MPVAADEPMKVPSTDFTPQGRPQSAIIRKLIEKFMKPKPPQSIPSGTIRTEQRDGALAPFTMTGVAVGRVNRDYDAFFETAWGSSPTSAPKTSAALGTGGCGRLAALVLGADVGELPQAVSKKAS